MTVPTFWSGDWSAALVNHLWQSTVVVGIAWLLAWALRRNHARARYWVWFAASVKFLLPFSFLIAAGERLRSIDGDAGGCASRQLRMRWSRLRSRLLGGRSLVRRASVAATHHANALPVFRCWRCGHAERWWLRFALWAAGGRCMRRSARRQERATAGPSTAPGAETRQAPLRMTSYLW